MKKTLFVFFLMFFLIQTGFSQDPTGFLGSSEKKAVVDRAASILAEQYVFPETARKMGVLIRKNLKAGKYGSIDDPRAFAMRLTEDLRSVSHDRHLGVRFAPELIRIERNTSEAARKTDREYQEKLDRLDNYGFREVRILGGNVGYLKFNHFSAAQEAFRVAVGAMAFLANCGALIIDLRENGGGNPEMIQLLSSYFFAGEPRHLNSFFYRMDEKTEQFWTLPYVPGSKLAETDLYVLTSRRTFSGAEEFTYNLKNLKRATIIGEATGGGAHPVRMEILNDNFLIGVPYARAVNPVSKTNWEGTGVEPDVKVPADQALATAQIEALEKLAAKEKDPRIRSAYRWPLESLQAEMKPVRVAETTLRSYAGEYGPRRITFENGDLFYQREGGARMKMIPLREDLFGFTEVSYFRLKIVRSDGQVTGIEGHYDDGTIDANPRTK